MVEDEKRGTGDQQYVYVYYHWFKYRIAMLYEYVPGYSKRTLLGGFLPAADIAVWNPHFKVGYEVMVILPDGADARPLGRVRALLPKDSSGKPIPAGDPNVGEARPELQDLSTITGTARRKNFSRRWRESGTGGTTFLLPGCKWRFLMNG